MHTSIIKLGLIGESHGNGHPFSWTAIINGYHPLKMKQCGYDSIPEYLSKQNWDIEHVPHAAITHIWTPDLSRSELIASTCKVAQPAATIQILAENVDAFIVARDDYKYNYHFALALAPFCKPILFDKQIAGTLLEARALINMCRMHGAPLFTGSPMARHNLVELKKWLINSSFRKIKATTPKAWYNYAVHILDPVMTALNSYDDFIITNIRSGENCSRIKSVTMNVARSSLPDMEIEFSADMDYNDGFSFEASDENAEITEKYIIRDPFACFKAYLNEYVHACLLYRNNKRDEVNRIEDRGIRHYLSIQGIIDKCSTTRCLT